jgi:16S rRNA (cytosine1402-N4)-methyltransferase
MAAAIHKPVLLKEVLEFLNPGQNENFVDCTVGEGGHSEEILKRNGPDGKVLGIDLDPVQISSAEWLKAQFKERIVLANDSYIHIRDIIGRKNFGPVNGILLDLGMSSVQLEGNGLPAGRQEKGFSFKIDQSLDMRYNDQMGYLTAEKIVNEWPEDKIENILKEYGEEKFSKKISKSIIEKRRLGRIRTTFQLIEVIKRATPSAYHKAKIHYATRTFQALRIAVNDELENIRTVLPEALSLLAFRGRLVVISFHSLEDRIVKNFLAGEVKKQTLKLLTKKPVTASGDEIRINPRSRSAKLRAIVKI